LAWRPVRCGRARLDRVSMKSTMRRLAIAASRRCRHTCSTGSIAWHKDSFDEPGPFTTNGSNPKQCLIDHRAGHLIKGTTLARLRMITTRKVHQL
jgi:hypothetical protein